MQKAFGRTYPLLERALLEEAYDNRELYETPSFARLFDLIVERIRTPVIEISWLSLGGPGTGGAGTSYFAPRPKQARAEIHRALAGLERGFARLTAIASREQAEEALATLSGTCRWCHEPVASPSEGGLCPNGHCPFCGAYNDPSFFDEERCEVGALVTPEGKTLPGYCRHVTGITYCDSKDGWTEDSPFHFSQDDVACLPRELSGEVWSGWDLERAFGDVREVLAAYSGDLTSRPRPDLLFSAYIEGIVPRVYWHGWIDAGVMCAGSGTVFLARDRKAVWEHAHDLYHGLQVGFSRLATLRAPKQSESTA